ncbi:NOP protein chaperone 1-like [Tamandua tetradactyla]|uniref:NOP protein chaperone 1-like n=1 Tax=Tamandua tetradactyla TaxID=48850 RepID=UPI004053C41A
MVKWKAGLDEKPEDLGVSEWDEWASSGHHRGQEAMPRIVPARSYLEISDSSAHNPEQPWETRKLVPPSGPQAPSTPRAALSPHSPASPCPAHPYCTLCICALQRPHHALPHLPCDLPRSETCSTPNAPPPATRSVLCRVPHAHIAPKPAPCPNTSTPVQISRRHRRGVWKTRESIELCGRSQRRLSCLPPTWGCAGVSASKELLAAGSSGGTGILDRLFINSRPNSKKNTLQTLQVERSPLLGQVQTFLPKMVQTNEKLIKEMATVPHAHFDTKNVDGTPRKVIQMNVALFEMNWPDLKEDISEENIQNSSEVCSKSEDEDESTPYEANIDPIKLPNSEGRKGKTEVLDSPASKKLK